MKLSIIESAISEFLKTSKPEVMAIKGEWGVGKTYLWKKMVSDIKGKDESFLRKYCYVSLFGITSLQDLTVTIFSNMIKDKTDNKKLSIFTSSKWRELSKFLPYGEKITIGIDTLAPIFIKDMVICFDDFERMKDDPNKLSADELLGFISNLKEEKSCKIVLIFNENELKSEKKELYIKYREKVIDKEIIYSPNINESLALVFNEHPNKEIITNSCQLLNIINFRLLYKIKEFTELLSVHLEELDSELLEQTLQTLILAIASFYSANETIPRFETLCSNHSISHASLSKKTASIKKTNETDEIENGKLKRCLTLFKKYQLNSFDYSIIQIVKQGFIEGSNFISELNQLKDNSENRKIKLHYNKLWHQIYAGSFQDNQDEFVTSLIKRFKECVSVLDLNELNNTAIILNDLNESKQSKLLVDYFFEHNSAALSQKDDHDYLPFFTSVSMTPYLQKRYDDHIQSLRPKISLREALMYMLNNSGWKHEHDEVVKQANEDDFYQLFTKENSEALHGIVTTALERSPKKVTSTLKRIAKENHFNKIRIQRLYKIYIKDDTD